MSLTISWINYNEGFAARVYKSAEAFDETSIPETPAVTLAVGVDKWVDQSMNLGDSAYYMVEFFKAGETPLRSRVRKYTVGMEAPYIRQGINHGTTGVGQDEGITYNGRWRASDYIGSALDNIVGECTGAAATDTVSFDEFVVDGRLFLYTYQAVALNPKMMIEKGFFFMDAHRHIPEGVDTALFPESKPFIYRGHKFAVGLPWARLAADASAKVNLNDFRDSKNFVVPINIVRAGGLAQWISTWGGMNRDMVNLGQVAGSGVGSSNTTANRPIPTSNIVSASGDVLTFTNFTGKSGTTVTGSTFTSNSTYVNGGLLIEYLGISNE